MGQMLFHPLSVRPHWPWRQGICGHLPQSSGCGHRPQMCCGHFPQRWCFGHHLQRCQGGHLPPRVSLKCEVHGGLPHQVCGTVPQRSPGNEFFSLVLGFGRWGLRSHSWVHWLYSEAVFSRHWAESYAPAGQLVQQLQHWPVSFLGQMCFCVVPQLFSSFLGAQPFFCLEL